MPSSAPFNPMHSARHVLACCVVSWLSLSTAQAQSMRPGQYEYTTRTVVFGMSIPSSSKQCVTQKDIESNKAYANQEGMKGCTPIDLQRRGPDIRVKYSCTSPRMTFEGTGQVSATGFNFDMLVTQHDMNNSTVKSTLSAVRLGDCS